MQFAIRFVLGHGLYVSHLLSQAVKRSKVINIAVEQSLLVALQPKDKNGKKVNVKQASRKEAQDEERV